VTDGQTDGRPTDGTTMAMHRFIAIGMYKRRSLFTNSEKDYAIQCI